MTEEDYLLIDKKLNNELTSDEVRAFEQRYAQDPAFAEEYLLQQQLVDTLCSQHAQQLKEEMKTLHEEVKAERRRHRYRWAYAVAAAIALLLVAGAAFFYFRAPTSEALYSAYYYPYRAKVMSRGTLPERRNRAEDLYSEGNFTAAIPILKDLSVSDSIMADRWRLILGNAYLQSDSIPQAIQQFERVASSENAEYRQFARWYTALSHLKTGNQAATRAALQPIAEQPGLFQLRAQQLLHELP